MRLELSGVFSIGSAIGWFMTQFFAKDPRLKKGLKWLFGITCLTAAVVAVWPSGNAKTPPTTPTSNVINAGAEPTIIGSVGQQGGQTFQTIIVTNTPSAPPLELTGAYTALNVLTGNKYVTTANLHLNSPYPIHALSVLVHGTNIEDVSIFPAGSMWTTGLEKGSGRNSFYCKLLNPYGNLRLIITSTASQEFQLAWKFN